MRNLGVAMMLVIALSAADCASVSSPIEIPITVREDAAVTVPFSVTSTGTHDLELQYHVDGDRYFDILHKKLLDNIAGTVTVTCEGKSLQRELPTGWIRPWGPRAGRAGTVIVRFQAEAQKRYLCTLHVTHVPFGLPAEALLIVRYVTPHFHPGHRVYELQ
jgi:hypothetical protein